MRRKKRFALTAYDSKKRQRRTITDYPSRPSAREAVDLLLTQHSQGHFTHMKNPRIRTKEPLPKPQWLKKTSSVPKRIGVHGEVGIRPVSFHMDKRIDKFVVSGGGHKPVITGGKRAALKVANARIRVMEKHRVRKMSKK